MLDVLFHYKGEIFVEEILVSHNTVMRMVSKMPSLNSDNFEDVVSKLLDYYDGEKHNLK